ncbi:MAG: NADH-quinone oxidoreductase subunit A [Myxococcota bacterium]
MSAYWTILVLLGVAAAIAAVFFILTSTLGPRSRNWRKDEPYECGNIPTKPFQQRVSVRFYIVALLFILFDMEAVFLFPWAVSFQELGMAGLWSMITFVCVLTLGLVYVWKKGALEWE